MPQHDPVTGQAREELCRLLSVCYYEPGADFAEERLFERMALATARIDPQLADSARALGEAFATQELPALMADHERLFAAPDQPLAAPWASRWLGGDDAATQESALALLGLYEEAGFELEDEFLEHPDHVALELEFLGLLTGRVEAARAGGHDENLAAWETLRRPFLAGHLRAWIGRFAAAVQTGAGTAFYRELAAFTVRFVAMEVELQQAG